MKGKRIGWLACVAAALVIALSGCGAEAEAPPAAEEPAETPEICTVTFYDGERMLLSRRIPAGKTVGSLPAGVALWRDETGTFVEPSDDVVSEDRRFFAWQAPALRTDHGILIEAPGERFYPAHELSRGEAARIAQAMVAEAAPENTLPPADMRENSPEYEAVRTAVGLGLMTCYPDGTFRPRDTMTKGEFAALLYRLAGMPGAVGIEDGKGTEAAVAWAVEQGCVPDGRFRDGETITRREAAVMTARFRGAELTAEDAALACPGSPFFDVDTDDPAYSAILDTAYRNELLDYILGSGTNVRPGMVLLGERLCHVNRETGRLDRYDPGFVTIDGELYRVSEPGYYIDRMTEGLVELEDGMYYVLEDDGPFLTEGDYGCLHFGADGRYTSGSQIVDDYLDELLGDILHSDLSRWDKLYRSYCAIRDGGFFYGSRNAGWSRGSDIWALGCAETMYTEKYGTCYYWAAAFLYAARRVGYQAYPVCGGVGTRNQVHAWVVVIDDGQEYICDVELEWAYSWGFYDGFYEPTDMFMQPLYNTQVIYVFPDQDISAYLEYGVSQEESDEELVTVPESALPIPEPMRS